MLMIMQIITVRGAYSSIGPMVFTQMQKFWRYRQCGTSVKVYNVSFGLFIFYWERIDHWYFMGVFNKTIIPIPLSGYGIILWATKHVAWSSSPLYLCWSRPKYLLTMNTNQRPLSCCRLKPSLWLFQVPVVLIWSIWNFFF